MSRHGMVLVSLAASFALVGIASAQAPDYSKVEIKTQKVADGVWMLQGAGGNIGVSAGPDGVIVIDDEFAPLTEKILAAIKTISDQPVRFLLNTHCHGDHTGGNENFGKAGVVIVAQDNVRKRMSVDQFNALFNRAIPASPEKALPIVTFSDAVTFHFNSDTLFFFHVAPAHTDGDAIIQFQRVNAIHMGDCFFNGRYPVIDLSAGGSVQGMIDATARVLGMIDANTKLIPGHGPLGDRAALQAFHDMLVTVRDRVKKLVDARKTLDEVVAAKPTADLDAQWGTGGMKPEIFVKVVYTDLTTKK